MCMGVAYMRLLVDVLVHMYRYWSVVGGVVVVFAFEKVDR